MAVRLKNQLPNKSVILQIVYVNKTCRRRHDV